MASGPGPGHRPRHRTAARADPARDDHRVRRFAHLDPRRIRGAGVRDRDQRGRDGPRHPDAPPARPEDLRGARRRAPRPRGQCQGHHPGADRPDRDRRRDRPRLRIRRRGDPRPDDGTADDRLQHEHRGRRAGRADRPGRHDLRIPPRPDPRSGRACLGRLGRAMAHAADRRRRELRQDHRHRRRHARADGHLRHQPGDGHPDHQPRPIAGRPGRPEPAARPRARARIHGPPARPGDPRPEGRCRLRRELHQRPDQRPASRGERAQGSPRRGRRAPDGRPRLGRGEARSRGRGPVRDLQGGRRGVARSRAARCASR